MLRTGPDYVSYFRDIDQLAHPPALLDLRARRQSHSRRSFFFIKARHTEAPVLQLFLCHQGINMSIGFAVVLRFKDVSRYDKAIPSGVDPCLCDKAGIDRVVLLPYVSQTLKNYVFW